VNPLEHSTVAPSVVLITGGSAGIGAACVREFLTAGWNVSVAALPDGNVDWLRSLDVVTTTGDITSEQTRKAAVDRTLTAYGRIDVLINNAGVGLYARATEVPSELFTRLLDVNVIAPLALAQRVIPIMRGQGSGTIVTLSSVAARVSLPWAPAYSASKSALDAVHDSLRIELRRSPVHLLKVVPGIIDTEFRKHVLAGKPPEPVEKIRYIVSPDRLASAILRAVKTRRKTLYLPAIGSLFGLAGTLAPWVMDLYLSRLLSSTERRGFSAMWASTTTKADEG
jgi:NAD(P)-dependent dehydrogenase (short-subunit alcohol dehydrogenase family)